MSVVRTFVMIVAVVSLSQAASPEAIIVVHQPSAASQHLRKMAIVAVDGRPLKGPQNTLMLSPGRHTVSIRTWFTFGREKGTADAPWEQTLKAHRYSLNGELSDTGEFTMHVIDETEHRHSR